MAGIEHFLLQALRECFHNLRVAEKQTFYGFNFKTEVVMQSNQTFADLFKARGVGRRDFLKFCSLTSVYLGLSPSMVPAIVQAMENKPRTPVIWIHGLECTCCSESFIRSSHPTIEDLLFNMISLDYDCLLYTSPSPRDRTRSRMPSSA